MPLSALKLGEALASRLNAIVPRPLHVSVDEPSSPALRHDVDVIVRVADGAEVWGGQGFSNVDLRPDDTSSLGDVACTRAMAIISGVQDSISRILREPWPRLPTGDMALPDGRADSGCVYLWYGESEDRAVLTLRPIEIREISL